MKKLLLIAMLTISATSNASVLKVCAAQATEVCKELTGDHYIKCHNSQMDFCLDVYKNTNFKSSPECIQECMMLADEARVKMCLRTCSPE